MTTTCNPPLLPNSAWATPDTQLFQIGTVGDGIQAPADYDLTFGQLSIGPFTGIVSWVSLVGSWNDNPPIPPYVMAYGIEGWAAGFFTNATTADTIGGNRVKEIKLTCSTGYGQGIGIGLAYDPRIDGANIIGGRHNIGSINGGVAYVVKIRDCVLEQASDANLYLCGTILSASGLALKYFANSTAILKGCDARFTDTFTTDSPTCRYVFKMLDNRGEGGFYSFQGGNSDFEGPSRAGISPLAYWYCERDPDTPRMELSIANFDVGRLGGPAHVILKDSPLGGPVSFSCRATVPEWMWCLSDPCWTVKRS